MSDGKYIFITINRTFKKGKGEKKEMKMSYEINKNLNDCTLSELIDIQTFPTWVDSLKKKAKKILKTIEINHLMDIIFDESEENIISPECKKIKNEVLNDIKNNKTLCEKLINAGMIIE